MVLLEFIGIVIIILLVYLLFKISKKGEGGTTDTGVFGQVMKSLGTLETTIKEKEKKEEERSKTEAARMQSMEKAQQDFMRVISGTKKRGEVGEALLKEALSPSIKAGLIKTNLKVDNKTVEFAWDLKDGKYIPIDAKLADVIELFNKYHESENITEQKKIKKEVSAKLKKHIDEIRKYQNKRNTINKCIIGVPDGVIDMVPEINSDSEANGVIVSGYSSVFLYGNLIAESYRRAMESGDVGEYQQVITELQSILTRIQANASTIDKGLKIVENANSEIKEQTIQSERYQVQSKNKRKKK